VKTLAAAILLVGVLSLQACTYVPEVERTDLSAVKSTATRSEIEAVLGEPIGLEATSDGSISVYPYNRGAQGETKCCGRSGFELLLGWAATPFLYADKVDEQTGYLVIVYSVDDRVVRTRRVTVDGDPDRLVDREAELIDRAIAREAELTQRAEDGDPDAMYQIALGLPSGRSVSWFCKAANGGHPRAPYHLGRSYYYGLEPIQQDHVQAYAWYSLARASGSDEPKDPSGGKIKTETGWRCCFPHPSLEKIAEQMTPLQLAEAAHLVAEWETNPAECEVTAAQADN
jgi:hypothetical protein